MQILCPHCGQQLIPSEEMYGKTATCSNCKGLILVPNLPTESKPDYTRSKLGLTKSDIPWWYGFSLAGFSALLLAVFVGYWVGGFCIIWTERLFGPLSSAYKDVIRITVIVALAYLANRIVPRK